MPIKARDFGIAQLGTAFSVLATITAGKIGIIRTLHATNTSSPLTLLSICLVPSGDSPAEANAVAWDFPVEGVGGQSIYQDDGVHNLGAGGTIQAKASIAGVLTFKASGAEE